MRDVIEKAVRLLRQGHNREALRALERALDITETATPIPAPIEKACRPSFFVEKDGNGGHLCIDDTGWHIEPSALKGLPSPHDERFDEQVKEVLDRGIATGLIRRL